MDLREALRIAAAARGLPARPVGLACGCTPLHLGTFLAAHLTTDEHVAQVVTGPYGDLAGAVDALAAQRLHGCAVVLDWPDLDPRLGVRTGITAGVADPDDIVATATARLDRFGRAVRALAATTPVALVRPVLVLPPSFSGRAGTLHPLRVRLDALVDRFADIPGVTIVAAGGDRDRDLTAEFRSDFPYSTADAAQLTGLIAAALRPAAAFKGLITDLDDTFWRGLVGEVGPDGVTWDLDAGSQEHAVYQHLLATLAERGALLAVVSKNDPDVVASALKRPDLICPPDTLFPVVASWDAKSGGIADVLSAWNISERDVVFVDDNPMELAEAAARFPDLTALQFPTRKPNEVRDLVRTIAELFPPRAATAEDALRRESLRAAADLDQARGDAVDEDAFRRDLAATITLDEVDGPATPRALELVNKTNQFNLDGARYDEVGWRELRTRPGGVVATVDYRDRFGALGVISVLAGRVEDRELHVDSWVLSCRAFARGIEEHVLAALLDRHGLDAAQVRFVATDRNSAAARFLQQYGGPDGPVRIARAQLPEPFHDVSFTADRTD